MRVVIETPVSKSTRDPVSALAPLRMEETDAIVRAMAEGKYSPEVRERLMDAAKLKKARWLQLEEAARYFLAKSGEGETILEIIRQRLNEASAEMDPKDRVAATKALAEMYGLAPAQRHVVEHRFHQLDDDDKVKELYKGVRSPNPPLREAIRKAAREAKGNLFQKTLQEEGWQKPIDAAGESG